MRVYILILFILIGHWTNGQITSHELLELNKRFSDNHPENYQLRIQEYNKLPLDSMDGRTQSIFYQMLSSYYSFIGDYETSRFNWAQLFIDPSEEYKVEYDTAFWNQHKLIDAKDYIVERAKNEKVVMINEAHNIPYHRTFALQLLKDFSDMGFKYLAIEDLSDENINESRKVTDTTGYYICEPLFAEMVREALRKDFILITYDVQNAKNNRMRDSLQAVNLAKVLKNDPHAKILVYAGYDHIHEDTRTDWKKMAQFFKEFTGIDPLTISQTQHVEQYQTEIETVEFRTVHRFGLFDKPMVAIKNDSVWHDQFVDISIFSPRYLTPNQRPRYLTIDERRKPIMLNTQKEDQGLFVQAFYADEKKGHRIPADQIFIRGGKDFVYLYPGKYILEFKNTNDKVLRTESIEVQESSKSTH